MSFQPDAPALTREVLGRAGSFSSAVERTRRDDIGSSSSRAASLCASPGVIILFSSVEIAELDPCPHAELSCIRFSGSRP